MEAPESATHRAVWAVLLWSSLAGVAVFAASTVWRPLSILALVTLVVVTPSAEWLTTRILINVPLILGMLALAALVPIIPMGRTGLTAGLMTAGLTAWLLYDPQPTSALIRPRVRASDWLLGPIALLAIWIASPYLRVQTPAEALSALSLGWDHSGHASMFIDQYFTGAWPPWLPPSPDGSLWRFQHYPQWFHSHLVVLAEGFWPRSANPGWVLVQYSRLQGVVFIGLCLTVAASVLSATRSMAWFVRAAAVAVAGSALLGFPGPFNLLQGHLPFLIAACSVALAALLYSEAESAVAFRLASGAALAIWVASWPLLLPIAALAFGPLLARHAGKWRPPKAALAMIALALSMATYQMLLPLTSPLDDYLTQTGPVLVTSRFVTPVLLMLGLALAFSVRGKSGRVLLALCAAGGLVLALLAGFQVATAGELSYYFDKASQGLQVAVLLVMSTVLAAFLTRLRHLSRLLSIGIGMLAGLGLGMTLPTSPSPAVATAISIPGLQMDYAASTEESKRLVDVAQDFADLEEPLILVSHDLGRNPPVANQWFHALARTSTLTATQWDEELYYLPDDTESTVTLVMAIMADVQSVVLTDQVVASAVRDEPGCERVYLASFRTATATNSSAPREVKPLCTVN